MRISPIPNFQYKITQKHSPISFRASIAEDSSTDSFEPSRPKVRIDGREVIEAFKDNSIFKLREQEKRGEIEVDWNIIMNNGDNLLMDFFKTEQRKDYYYMQKQKELFIELAKEGKIDVNYVNKGSYSLSQCAFMFDGRLGSPELLFKLENLDITKIEPDGISNEPIIKFAIKRGVREETLESLATHPSLDITKYDLDDLYTYIDEAPHPYRYYDSYEKMRSNFRFPLNDYNKKCYKEAIERAIKIHNAQKAIQYYKENGSMSLEQIQTHIENAKTEKALNLPLNDINQNIAHLLAEIPIDPKDDSTVQKVKDMIKTLCEYQCYFWTEDALGRTPLILALENKNLVVAKFMLKKMSKPHFKYQKSSIYNSEISEPELNHIPIIWNLIADLEPKDRKELGLLFFERLKAYR
ncbi:MAG: hypothetical protein NC191_03340 [Muribaculaceae bacterium]|nr:hypothetical protein [Muribaculaceae bacterium]